MKLNLPSRPLSRFSFSMLCLACLFWLSSQPYRFFLPIADDFPNCVSFGWEAPAFSTGAVSNNGTSTVFLTKHKLFGGRTQSVFHSERRDGHFCSFDIPESEYSEPRGFGILLNSNTVGWHFPYWAMILAWGALYFLTPRTRFSGRELLAILFIAALILISFECRWTLPWIVFLNLASAMLAIVGLAFLPFVVLKAHLLPSRLLDAREASFQPARSNDASSQAKIGVAALIGSLAILTFCFPASVGLWLTPSGALDQVARFGAVRDFIHVDLADEKARLLAAMMPPGSSKNAACDIAMVESLEVASFHLNDGNRLAVTYVSEVKNRPEYNNAIFGLRLFPGSLDENAVHTWASGAEIDYYEFHRPWRIHFWLGVAVMAFLGVVCRARFAFRVIAICVTVFAVVATAWSSFLSGAFVYFFLLYGCCWLTALFFGRTVSKDPPLRFWAGSKKEASL